MGRLINAAALSALLAACASTGTRVESSSLAQFKPGVSTEADVEKALGAPQSNSADSSGVHSIMYVYAHSQVKGATFIPIVGMFAGGASTTASTVSFHFDAAGKLIDYQTNQQNTDVSMGGASSSQAPAPH